MHINQRCVIQRGNKHHIVICNNNITKVRSGPSKLHRSVRNQSQNHPSGPTDQLMADNLAIVDARHQIEADIQALSQKTV